MQSPNSHHSSAVDPHISIYNRAKAGRPSEDGYMQWTTKEEKGEAVVVVFDGASSIDTLCTELQQKMLNVLCDMSPSTPLPDPPTGGFFATRVAINAMQQCLVNNHSSTPSNLIRAAAQQLHDALVKVGLEGDALATAASTLACVARIDEDGAVDLAYTPSDVWAATINQDGSYNLQTEHPLAWIEAETIIRAMQLGIHLPAALEDEWVRNLIHANRLRENEESWYGSINGRDPSQRPPLIVEKQFQLTPGESLVLGTDGVVPLVPREGYSWQYGTDAIRQEDALRFAQHEWTIFEDMFQAWERGSPKEINEALNIRLRQEIDSNHYDFPRFTRTDDATMIHLRPV